MKKTSIIARKGYSPINGLKMYYEIHGSGRPLILLHGSFNTINTSFGTLIPELSKTRQVIAVEMQGHGRTSDIDRPFSFESLADDIADLLKNLDVNRADIFGYSLGGIVAFQLGIRHPGSVRKLIITSAPFKFDGWYPETKAAFPNIKPELFDGTIIKKEYDRLAPNPKHWIQFVNKLEKLSATPFDFTAAKVRALKAPVLIIIGDSDGVQPEHAVEIFRLKGGGKMGDLSGLPNSQLAVLPGTTHGGVMYRLDLLLSIIPAFLDTPVKSSEDSYAESE